MKSRSSVGFPTFDQKKSWENGYSVISELKSRYLLFLDPVLSMYEISVFTEVRDIWNEEMSTCEHVFIPHPPTLVVISY